MAGGTNKLTDRRVKAFLAGGKDASGIEGERDGKRLWDGQGLYLQRMASGSAKWRFKYRTGGKETTYTIGPYPDISLAQARTELAKVREQTRAHMNPVVERRLDRAAAAAANVDTFASVAQQWLAMKRREWSEVHFKKSARALERDIYPELGQLPISRISSGMITMTMEKITARSVHETASRILQHVNGVFRFAEAKDLCKGNPATSVREVLQRKRDSTRMPALLKRAELGQVLRHARLARTTPQVYLAHRLIAFSVMRISNIVNAEWKEFDLEDDQPIWTIPRANLKKKDKRFPDHRIPLGPTIAAELREWKLATGGKGLLFPSPTNAEQPITREALEKFYRVTLKLNAVHTPHGWRSSLTTRASEEKIMPNKLIQVATDHASDSETALAYDRGEYFDDRIILFRWWDDVLTKAQATP